MNTQPRAFIFLAEGFEITEAMAPADILIRGGIELNIISIGSTHAVTSAQRISVNAESTLEEYPLDDIRKEDIMIFPGGMPGTSNLAECAPLMNRMQRHFAEGGTVAAICAAPGLVLSMLPLSGLRFSSASPVPKQLPLSPKLLCSRLDLTDLLPVLGRRDTGLLPEHPEK